MSFVVETMDTLCNIVYRIESKGETIWRIYLDIVISGVKVELI